MGIFDVYPCYNITIEKAKDMLLWDSEGNEYLDMYGGHAVISVGHSNYHFVNMLKKQIDKIAFYSNSIVIQQQQELAHRLTTISGKEWYNMFLCNSGAEANENAFKLASFHNGKKKIISFSGSFHGRTSLAVAATDDNKITAPVNENSDVVILPYNDIEALEEEFMKGGVTAVIVEAIQGVGGVQVATQRFLEKMRMLCYTYDAVMIADCVQCGCGRTGRYFALDESGVEADIYTMAKGIGNGFPMGGLLISPKIRAEYGMLGTTFGGSYLACTAALAVIDEIEDRELMKNAGEMGHYLVEEIKALKSDKILEVRGRGLMIGVEFNCDATPIRSRLLSMENIFVGNAKNKRIIRLLPSMTISKNTCDKFVKSLKKVL
ncbi:MAG: aminotransferase class III-fold pyridoxal phosphate-dependent enzyme [Rikenellaceae bacterium]